MTDNVKLLLTTRRDFVVGAGATAVVVALLGAGIEARAADRSAQFETAYKALLGSATPQPGGVAMDIPNAIDNGAFVPVALSVDSPMTADNYVKAIHLLSTANPAAAVATFHFTLLSGKATVTSRMRLAQSQEVVAVAALSDGTFLMSTRTVDVKVGGCGI